MALTKPRFLLDSVGDALEVGGYTAVRTEADFLHHALGSTPLLVQGSALCRWAEEFCDGRDLSWAKTRSPIATLQAACHTLTTTQAEYVLALLDGAYQELPQPPNAADVLRALYPEGPWQEMPSRHHAARWLLWLDSSEPVPDLQPLLVQTAEHWRDKAASLEEGFYSAHDADAARNTLKEWMGITSLKANSYEPFPLPVPARWREQAHEVWSQESLSSRTGLLDRVRQRKVPDALLEVAAELSLAYYKHHPEKLTPDQLRRLETYLSYQDFADLQVLCPPDDPGPLPDTAPAVLRWFEDRYLPFRQWEVTHGDNAAHARSEDLARQFAKWCLGFYPTAVAGGSGQSHLAIHHAKQLRQSRQGSVTLWVIFDGLTYADGQTLAERLSQNPRLSQDAAFPVLSTLPTITSFCKRAMINGVPPSLVTDQEPAPNWEGARMLERNKDPQTQMANASEGDVFIWSLTEPDKTYHARFDALTVRRNVQSQLENWARKIIDAALSVPDALSVRIVFSADHGRLLTAGERHLTVPADMKADGRAAYGNVDKAFDASGVFFTGDVVYLNRDRFRLPMDCAVAFGPDVFETSDGKTGQELFPHGGLYPEEVLIPWMEFVRDRRTPTIRCVLSGQGRSGAASALGCRFENIAFASVTAIAVHLNFGGTDVRVLPLNLSLPAMEETRQEVMLSQWPTNLQIERATATLEYMMLNGTRFEGKASLELKSDEMQRRDVSLEDL